MTDLSGGSRRRVRVVVVDDSPVMQRAITRILESDDEIEVVATARDGAEAIELARNLRPDVMTLDVNMPRLDGLRAAQVIMGRHPTPLVLLSAFADPGGHVESEARAHGVVHVLKKPSEYGVALDLDQHASELRRCVRSASRIRVVRNASFGMDLLPARDAAPAMLAARSPRAGLPMVAIGASTGGTVVLAELLAALPGELPAALLIVQHMPPGCTREWAGALDATSAVRVVEARHGDMVRPGRVYIAPGGHHMELRADHIRLSAGPRVKMHRPSVDVLFDSLRPIAPRVICVLLTGMGDDGVAAMVRLHAAGASTAVQDRNSAVVWGMGGAAVRVGCVEQELAPLDLARWIVERTGELARNGAEIVNLQTQAERDAAQKAAL